MNTIKHSGILNMYFPCTIHSKSISHYRRKFERCRKRQQKDIRKNNRPSTDLLDVAKKRYEVEEVLTDFIDKKLPELKNEYSPYATVGIQKSYRGLREDMLFSKTLSVLVEEFTLCTQSSLLEDIRIEGQIILNINTENAVGSFVVCMPFVKLGWESVVYLKHVFYKRLLVRIDSESYHSDSTIQKYICHCIERNFQHLKIRFVDYRARYSFLELYGTNNLQKYTKEYYGMLRADESAEYTQNENLKKCFKRNLFNRNTRGYYVFDTNAIVLQNLENNQCVFDSGLKNNNISSLLLRILYHSNNSERNSDNKRYEFRDFCARHTRDDQISVKDEKYEMLDYVAGTKNNLYPEFLRSVEIHYLLDRVLTSEIEEQSRSVLKLWIIVYRAYKLWIIIYERAVNRYHINEVLMEKMGINKNIRSVKEEYNSLIQLLINYVLVFMSMLTLVATILSIHHN